MYVSVHVYVCEWASVCVCLSVLHIIKKPVIFLLCLILGILCQLGTMMGREKFYFFSPFHTYEKKPISFGISKSPAGLWDWPTPALLMPTFSLI